MALSPYQQLLMGAQAGASAAPRPQQAPAPQQAPKPSRLDRMLSNYDKFATAGADPSTLNPQQRSLMRRQLAMQIGGALQAERPIAAGVNSHVQNIEDQQAFALEQQEKEAVIARQQALQGIFQRGGGGAQAPAGEPLDPNTQAGRMQARAQAQAQYQAMLDAGLFEEANDFSRQIARFYPEVNLTQLNTGDGTNMIDPLSGAPVARYDVNPSDYQQWRMQGGGARAAGGNAAAPQTAEPQLYTDPKTGVTFYNDGRGWKPVPGGRAGAGAASAPEPLGNGRSRSGQAILLDATYSQAAQLTGFTRAQLEQLPPEKVAELVRAKGRRTMQGPVLGNIPFLSAVANADVAPYASLGGAGQAMVLNETGTITKPDQDTAEKSQPNYVQPIEVQADLIQRNLEQAAARGQRAVVRRGRSKATGRKVVEYSDGTIEELAE